MFERMNDILKDDRTWRRALLAVVALSLGAALALVALRPPTAAVELTRLNDQSDYDHLARTLIEHFSYAAPTGEPTAFRPPAYPVFLAIVYTVFGKGNLLAVALVQALLHATNVLLTAWLARRSGFGRPTALIAALAHGLYPSFVFQVTQLLTEVTGRTQLLLALGLLMEALRRGCSRWYLAAGAAMALAILNKSALAAAAPFLGLAIIAQSADTWPLRLRRAGAYALAAGLVLGAWTVRNYAHTGRFVPVSTNFPVTFAQSLSRRSFYTELWYEGRRPLLPVRDDMLELTQLRHYRGMADEMETGAMWGAKARAFVAENPAFFAELTARKAAHFWSPTIRNARAAQALAFSSMAPVLLLGWWGLVRGRRETRDFRLVALAIALPVTAVYAISQPDVRYRLALIDPIWMIMAASVAARWAGAGPREPAAPEPPRTPRA